MSTQQEIGEMRLGSMQPATANYPLPTTFHITTITETLNYTTFFCDHNDMTGEPLTWINQNTINIRGQNIPLQITPSHRTRWNTFTVKTDDWKNEQSPPQ